MSMYIQRASSQYTDKLTLCYLKREGIGEKFCSSLQQRVFDYAEVDLSFGGGGEVQTHWIPEPTGFDISVRDIAEQ